MPEAQFQCAKAPKRAILGGLIIAILSRALSSTECQNIVATRAANE
jgi:hypothetical protein